LEIGRRSAFARGETPWTDSEKQTLYESSLLHEFIHQQGIYRGKTNWQLVAEELTRKYHQKNNGAPHLERCGL